MPFASWFDGRRAAVLSRTGLGLLGVATLAGFAGGLWWVFDLFSHFRVQYVLAAALLGIVLGLVRQPRWVIGALALAVANLVPIVPLFLPHAEAAAPASGDALRMLSFNVFGFNHQYDRMLEYVGRERPDVLVLLEVTPEWMPSIRRLASDYPYQWINAGTDVTGIAVMSRQAPRGSETVDLARHGVPSYLLTFEHPNGNLSVLGTHLSWPIGARASRIRNSQLAALAQFASAHPGRLVILGDLNVTPFSPHFQRLLHDGGLERCVPGAGLTPTWPARFPPLFIQIDHCLASARVQARNFRVGDYLGSDHYPISVEVAPVREESPTRLP